MGGGDLLLCQVFFAAAAHQSARSSHLLIQAVLSTCFSLLLQGLLTPEALIPRPLLRRQHPRSLLDLPIQLLEVSSLLPLVLRRRQPPCRHRLRLLPVLPRLCGARVCTGNIVLQRPLLRLRSLFGGEYALCLLDTLVETGIPPAQLRAVLSRRQPAFGHGLVRLLIEFVAPCHRGLVVPTHRGVQLFGLLLRPRLGCQHLGRLVHCRARLPRKLRSQCDARRMLCTREAKGSWCVLRVLSRPSNSSSGEGGHSQPIPNREDS